ncbi:MAG: hypothetical protein MK102_07025 [Fuerstiella sp.]|nr:hypothetical protein [Fuerstiella sp.]
MKGPSLHHALNVMRVWTCPDCGRSTRTGGKVTTRRCECSNQSQMEYSDPAPLPHPDVSSFVTYLSPELQEDDDDGTDLPLPNMADLAPPATEPRGRRSGPGKPLRDTVADTNPETADPAFGEGIDNPEPQAAIDSSAADLATTEQVTVSADVSPDAKPPGKRRQRRRRRRSRQTEQKSVSQSSAGNTNGQPAAAKQTKAEKSDSTPSDHVESRHSEGMQRSRSVTSNTDGENDVSGSAKLDDGNPSPRKRRRRRRGPRKKKKPNSGEGNGGTESSSPGGMNS